MTEIPTDRLILDAEERRVLGTLAEKGLTTPQQYPLSVNSLVTGCNQRNNREPITNFNEEQIDAVLARLQARNLVSVVYPSTGRVHRWRQELGRNYELRRVDLAVVAELLLRGAQSEGELRQRASRMENVPTLEALHEVLQRLRDHAPPFVVRLTPEGHSRGVRWTHACMPQQEIDALVEAERSGASLPAAPVAGHAPAPSGATGPLHDRLDRLEQRVARLEALLARGSAVQDGNP